MRTKKTMAEAVDLCAKEDEMADNAEMQYRYGRMNTGDLILECERLRAALEKILYIRTISRLEPMTLDDAIKVAQDALTAAIGSKP